MVPNHESYHLNTIAKGCGGVPYEIESPRRSVPSLSVTFRYGITTGSGSLVVHDICEVVVGNEAGADGSEEAV